MINTCVHCGKVVHRDREQLCNHCGLPFRSPEEIARAKAATLDLTPFVRGDPVVVRSYLGRTQDDAAAAFQFEAAEVAQLGYRPLSQSWADGRPGAGRVLALGLLANSVRPDGSLTVTYGRTTDQEAGRVSTQPVDDTKVCPMCAETIRAAAKLCRCCRYEFVTD